MKQKDLVYILTSIATFTFFWIGFSLWHVYTTSTLKDPLASQLAQVPATFSTDVLVELKKRKTIIPQTTLTSATLSASPILTPTPLQTASPSSTPTSSPILLP